MAIEGQYPNPDQTTQEDADMTTTTSDAAHAATERMASAAHDAIDRAARTGSRVEERMRRTGEHTRERAHELQSEAESYVREHPYVSLGAAVAAGFLLGAILRR